MQLTEKIKLIYPELLNVSLAINGIVVQNDSDGRGDYIAEWNHPTLPKPTEDQLA